MSKSEFLNMLPGEFFTQSCSKKKELRKQSGPFGPGLQLDRIITNKQETKCKDEL